MAVIKIMAKEKFKLGKPQESCIVCGNEESFYHHINGRNVRPDLINDLNNTLVLCHDHHSAASKVGIHHIGTTKFIEINNLKYVMLEKGWRYDSWQNKWYLRE